MAVFHGLHLIAHKMTECSKRKWTMTTGEWFHCQVLNILLHHFVVYKSIDQRKLLSISINHMEKTQAEMALFSVKKAHTLHLMSFLLSVLLSLQAN